MHIGTVLEVYLLIIQVPYPTGYNEAFISKSFSSFRFFHTDDGFYIFALRASVLGLNFLNDVR